MGKFYITTAIDYANSLPHLGTAYEKIGADVIARYRRLQGDDVYFVLGNDEHSQNVRRKAEELGVEPQAYCDQMAKEFQITWKELQISHNFFIQTTSTEHREVVQDIASRIHKARSKDGSTLLYRAPYRGHYCGSCEAFYKEDDLLDGKCPNHKVAPQWIEEENYFFRLSSFEDRLKDLIQNTPDFVRPLARRNELVQLLTQGLEDISISRPNRGWGVPLPFDSQAVAYVWFDALINYVTAVGPIGSERFDRYWPADLHVIGKDITRFHCLVWPAMLMAANIPIPRGVWGHGFVSIGGEKMSKSRGNVADPKELTRRYGADSLRYHLMREVPWDQDGDFTEERLKARYNADLANDLGNLVSRTVTMVRKVGSAISKPTLSKFAAETEALRQAVTRYDEQMSRFDIDEALATVWELVMDSNQMIDRSKPWAMAKDPENSEILGALFYLLLERLRWCGVMLWPVMPEKMDALLRILGVDLHAKYGPGTWPTFSVSEASPLFPRQ